MKIEEIRPGVFSTQVTVHELSTLIAGARMSLSLMEADPGMSAEARDSLRAVLDDFDRALARSRSGEGR